jgi:hypothetical protein
VFLERGATSQVAKLGVGMPNAPLVVGPSLYGLRKRLISQHVSELACRLLLRVVAPSKHAEEAKWPSPDFPDTFVSIMCLGGSDGNEKAIHG